MNASPASSPLIITDDGNVDAELIGRGYFLGKFVVAGDTTGEHPTTQCYVARSFTSISHSFHIRSLLHRIYGDDAVPAPHDLRDPLSSTVALNILGGGSIQFPSDWQDETVKVRWGSITMRGESLTEFPEDVEEQRAIIHSIKEWITEKIRRAGLEIDPSEES
jgi:hypothetical protein